MSLLDLLRPPKPKEVVGARVVSLSGFTTPIKTVEKQKARQREHWVKNDRRKR